MGLGWSCVIGECVIWGLNQGAGGIWCDVDVVEFSYFGEPDHQPTPKQTFTTDIVDDLQGSDPFIGSGSQV